MPPQYFAGGVGGHIATALRAVRKRACRPGEGIAHRCFRGQWERDYSISETRGVVAQRARTATPRRACIQINAQGLTRSSSARAEGNAHGILSCFGRRAVVGPL